MINQQLHKQPVGVDRNEHRALRMRVPVTDWHVASELNSIFVAATEFGEAARDFPVVFVRVGTEDDGSPSIAPVAVFGVKPQQNLFIEPGGGWRASYMPAALRFFPFALGRVDPERFAICFDASWPGVNTTEGEALFDDAGEPTPFLKAVQEQLQALEQQTQRTRLVCRRLHELGLLRDMRFDATLPGGDKLTVDGFSVIDEAKLNALPDDQVLDLHKTGILSLVHAHYISLGHMRKLVDWHLNELTSKTTV